MQYVTVDSLHAYSHHKKKIPLSFFKELRRFWFVFILVFVGSLLFTNANLFAQAFKDTFSWDGVHKVAGMNDMVSSDNSISSLVTQHSEEMDEIDALVQTYATDASNISVASSLEVLLQSKIDSYDFEFNTLPPTNRLIIASLWIDVPLVDSIYKDVTDLSQWEFTEELMNGVVKYPTTPEPGTNGNTLFFWHTSQEWREKNPYGTVFSKIPKLQVGDKIEVIWEGNEYTYKVVTTVIKTPNKVNEEYLKYQGQDKQFVTLMWCYPLWRTDKRMMVIAERVE